ncbi:thiamine-phosphate pyrophosphorylase [Sulfurovum sp.]|jgi:thiamine-phosphate pyrophosphorylase|uniref:thiamine-phosphate pyrophosphorylase n=1 Tax=Sulfurovum sp. TaxID=1969726 RepID=UPI002A35EF75|nr:thiamine-phosphate pyrophosphorylase [Sulfurovum sp.]MDY0402885.1 thiamine-phosphate pyrophosphorylase [Sulfurovum sp.]
MTNSESPEKVARLIDANLNRLKEGIRVIEDINRYLYDDASLTSQLKSLRHRLQTLYSQERLYFRDIENDVQKKSIESELKRSSIGDLVIANFSRAQESARVLEESFKLIDPILSETAKEVRYSLYGIEKEFFLKHAAKEV